MAKYNSNSKRIQELNKLIDDSEEYTITDHNGKEVEMTGKKLKRYMLVMRNVIDFTNLEEEVKNDKKDTKGSVEKSDKKEDKVSTKNKSETKNSTDSQEQPGI